MFKYLTDGTSQAIETFHEKEYTEFLSQIGFVNPVQIRVMFSQSDLLSDADVSLKAIRAAGLAKICSIEGDLYKAQEYFTESFQLAKTIKKQDPVLKKENPLGYIYYEYGLFQRLLYSSTDSEKYFLLSQQYTSSKKILQLIQYQLEMMRLESGEKSDLERVSKMIEDFSNKNMHIMHIIGLRRLAILQSNYRDYRAADSNLRKSLHLAEKNGFQQLIWSANLSFGHLKFKQKKYLDSISYYENLLPIVKTRQLKTILYKNLGLAYESLGRFEDAVQICKEGLEFSQTYGVLSEIPSIANVIGQLLQNHTDTPQEAYHYFKIGYDESIRQEEAGLPLAGPRLRVVKKYVEYLASYLPKDFDKISVANYFEWALGRSWVKIQDLFHYNLFVYHFIHTGIGKATFKHLDLFSGTFYSLSKRMRDLRGISFPDFRDADMSLPPDLYIDSLQKYVQLHRDKTFKQVCEQFENDIYEFLFKESGYNKKRLSESLDLSYSVVLKHTKTFTEVSKGYTQPRLEAPK